MFVMVTAYNPREYSPIINIPAQIKELGELFKCILVPINILMYVEQQFCQVISLYYQNSRDAGAQSVTVKATGCGFDPHSRK